MKRPTWLLGFAALAVAAALGCAVTSYYHQPAPEPCCCVYGGHERTEPDYCDPADCYRHGADADCLAGDPEPDCHREPVPASDRS